MANRHRTALLLKTRPAILFPHLNWNLPSAQVCTGWLTQEQPFKQHTTTKETSVMWDHEWYPDTWTHQHSFTLFFLWLACARCLPAWSRSCTPVFTLAERADVLRHDPKLQVKSPFYTICHPVVVQAIISFTNDDDKILWVYSRSVFPQNKVGCFCSFPFFWLGWRDFLSFHWQAEKKSEELSFTQQRVWLKC